MGKRTKDLKPDIVLKNYWNNNEQFADLFNAVLFDGKWVIKPEELEDVDTEESTVLEHREYAEVIKASRDNIKIRKKSTVFGVELVLLGMESQEHIHYAMPMRIMGYDYGSYKKQYDSNAKKYKTAKGMTEDECKIDYNAFEKGDGKMCTLFEEIARENEIKGEMKGEIKGRAAEIVETGLEFGLSEQNILERLQNKLNVSLQTAQEYFEMFGKR